MIDADRDRYIELRVMVFRLAEEMAQRPEDDIIAFEFRRASDEAERLWERVGAELASDPSVEQEVRRLTLETH